MEIANLIQGQTLEQWCSRHPLLEEVIQMNEVFWSNPKWTSGQETLNYLSLNENDIHDAEARLLRLSSYISKVFPETSESNGIIESPIVKIPKMQASLESKSGTHIPGNFFLKCDSHLPIAGSIKARGGIYEVLKYAEELALQNQLLTIEQDYSVLDRKECRDLFSQYTIAVGSTGNLGLSIGIISAKLGFKVTVHMSADAKQWKKDLLRSKGVQVLEYQSDYGKAVEEGRKQALEDPNCYFVDDENSKDLFLGYSVAALRLKKQLESMDIKVDEDHPLFVYLPCGVGGAPGGITFGLKTVYKDNVHCFLGEPTHAPCMLLGLMTESHNDISVTDFGIDNITAADGLAVGRASTFVGKMIEHIVSGVYTVSDDNLYVFIRHLVDTEQIYLEPSAVAGFKGPLHLFGSQEGRNYLREHQLERKLINATHIIWATGGSMVPKEIMKDYYTKGLLIEGDLQS